VLLLCCVIVIGCGAGNTGNTTPGGGCNSGIEYQGRAYGLDASYKLFGINASSEAQAVREVSDNLKIYFEEAANLCSMFDQGALTSPQYLEQRQLLSARFSALADLNREIPADSISQNEVPIYVESLKALRSKTKNDVGFGAKIYSGDRVMQSGDALSSGSGFYITVDLPQKAYLYIVLIDSRGGASRLYPTALTGRENPVHGTISVPAQGELALDENTGTERILFFTQRDRSVAIENLLEEVQLEGNDASNRKDIAEILTRGVRVRKKMSQSTSTTGGANSFLGMEVKEFLIDHR
jgi:hypothetical protein